jgi:hypothetical protein
MAIMTYMNPEFRKLTEAAVAGDPSAQYFLARAYYNGGMPSEALKWFLKSATNGYSCSQFFLGRMCADGEYLTQDISTARMWMTAAAESGRVEAQFWNAVMMVFKAEFEAAFSKFKDIVKEYDHYGAMNNIGVMYFLGIGVKKSLKKAKKWFKKARIVSMTCLDHNIEITTQEIVKAKAAKKSRKSLSSSLSSITFSDRRKSSLTLSSTDATSLIAMDDRHIELGDGVFAEGIYCGYGVTETYESFVMFLVPQPLQTEFVQTAFKSQCLLY